MEKIKALDEGLFWWVNSHHNTFFDWVLWVFSQPWSWLIVLLAIYGIVTLRQDRKSWMWILLGIAICFLLSDQISNNTIKDGVQRLRPCYAFEDVRMFHTGRGGQYGFVSSHAANAFAVAAFLSFCYGGRRRGGDVVSTGNWWNSRPSGYRSPLLPYLLLLWASVVSYSRIYLGKHFPGDVVCGALLGLGIGAVVYFAISRIRLKISSKADA